MGGVFVLLPTGPVFELARHQKKERGCFEKNNGCASWQVVVNQDYLLMTNSIFAD